VQLEQQILVVAEAVVLQVLKEIKQVELVVKVSLL
jgi:hypothetical protein